MSNTDELRQLLSTLYAYDQAGGYVPLELDEESFNKLQDHIATVEAKAEKRQTELLDSLYWMYMQYCAQQGHLFMGAGETASELLEDAGYIVVDNIGVVTKDNGDSYEQLAALQKGKD